MLSAWGCARSQGWRKLYQLQVLPMERAVLLHTKVSIPLTIILFDLLGIFS